jgi:L-histidine N-alpha-methyltransferase
VTRSRPDVDVRLTPADRRAALRRDIADGLAARSKMIPSKWLYDERGSVLFDDITRLSEYYPTRAERTILDAHADEIAHLSGAVTMVELGSGTSTKTRLLLDACSRAGTLRRFVAFDVAESTVRDALDVLGTDYPALTLGGVIGDFETDLDAVPAGERRMVVFLGGTIGNLEPGGRKTFLDAVAGTLTAGETLLVGVDLVKDPARLVAAYDDAGGVTEAFEKNALAVVNAELHADFDLDAFAYRAAWSEVDERIEMGVVARSAQRVHVGDLDLDVDLAPGELIRTEVSAKFHLDRFAAELAGAGLDPVATWTDPPGDFALVLARMIAS